MGAFSLVWVAVTCCKRNRSRGRRPAAHRRSAPAPAPAPAQPDAPPAPTRGSLRQLMVTPTFVFGVTIVTMAVLAFGTTQTYLRFSAAGPDNGCGVARCARPDSGHTARGRASGGAVADGAAHGSALRSSRPAPASRAHIHPLPRIAYRTTQVLSAGFFGLISITGRAEPPTGDWWFSFRYPGVQITSMTGATWHVSADGVVTIEPVPQTPALGPGATLTITFAASGPASAPSRCRFDGARCHIGS